MSYRSHFTVPQPGMPSPKDRVAELRRRFVDGPVLTMPAPGRGTSDTTDSVVIPQAGTVFFRNFTLTAQWGHLDANNGVLNYTVNGVSGSKQITRQIF